MSKDAASADLGVEARHAAAQAMVRRFARHEDLADVVRAALDRCEPLCLDDESDRVAVAAVVVAAIADSADARFLRELLGPEPAGRMTRMHAHGALLDRATQAAWRLAGGR